MFVRKIEKVYEVEHSQLDKNWDEVLQQLGQGRKVALFFLGNELEFSGKLIRLFEYKDLVLYVLKISRDIDLKNFPQNLPIWLHEKMYVLPIPYSRFDSKTLTCEETYKYVCTLREKGLTSQILPYRDFDGQEQVSETRMLFDYRSQKKPKTSVIVPSRNYGEYLPNVIRHLLDQDVASEEFEVIVVDDASTDGSFELIANLVYPIKATANICYLYVPRGEHEANDFRAGFCRNRGIRVSRGENIIFLDSDMLVPTNFIEVANQALSEVEVIQFPRHHIKPELSGISTRIDKLSTADVFIEEEHYWLPFFSCDDWMSLPQFWKYACTYGLGLKRRLLEEVGIFREVFKKYGFEDTELAFRMAKSGARFKLVEQPIYHLTPPVDKSRYRHSQILRQLMLAKTAKTFFLSTLDPEIYYFTRHYLRGESRWAQRFYALFG